MYRFLVTLHVLASILVIGPFALLAFSGWQSIRRHDAARTRTTAVMLARFATGSLLVAVLGMGALGFSTRYSFRSPWVIISLTLYVIVMGVATGYTVPALRRAANILTEGVIGKPAAEAPEEDAPATLAATATDLATKERLDGIAGRVVGSGALVLLIVCVITVLMVVRPFGR